MENETIINKDQLLPAVQKMLDGKMRFATATCIDIGDKFEMIYTFEPKESIAPLTNLRLRFARNETIPSISGIYFAAIVAENEIVGDFPVQMSGLPLDFQRQIMHTKDSLQFPLAKTPPVPKAKEGEVKPPKK